MNRSCHLYAGPSHISGVNEGSLGYKENGDSHTPRYVSMDEADNSRERDKHWGGSHTLSCGLRRSASVEMISD